MISKFPFLKPPGRTEWILAGILIGCTPLLFVPTPEVLSGYTGRAINNLGHIPLFALVTVLLYRMLACRPPAKWLLISGVVAFSGAGVEYLQTWVGRNASIDDVLRNLLGAWLALSWLSAASTLVIALRAVTTALALFQLAFTFAVAITEYRVLRQQPLIANFESPFEDRRWRNGRAVRSQDYVSEGNYSLKVQFNTNRWSPSELPLLPRDWRGYESLKFDIYNPDPEPLRLLLRIDDLHRNWYSGDRFNTWLDLQPGWNKLAVSLEEIKEAPTERDLDMERIRQIIIASHQLPAPRVIYTDHWRLE